MTSILIFVKGGGGGGGGVGRLAREFRKNNMRKEPTCASRAATRYKSWLKYLSETLQTS